MTELVLLFRERVEDVISNNAIQQVISIDRTMDMLLSEGLNRWFLRRVQ